MSGLLSLLLVSLSVGLSNFAGAIGIGLSGIDAKARLRVGILFGLFESLMPVIGLLLGEAVAGYLGHIAKYVGGAILVLTGAYTIWQGRRTAARERVTGTVVAAEGLRTRQILVTAMALSIDNLAVGFAIAQNHVNIALAAVMMGVVSVALTLVGLELGNRLGERVEEWSEEIGGAVLVDGYLYGSAGQTVFCADFATGKVKWTDRSVGPSSVCFADGRLYVRGHGNGEVALVDPSPEAYQEVGRLKPAERSKIQAWPHPVIAIGGLYLRDQDALLCYEISTEKK